MKPGDWERVAGSQTFRFSGRLLLDDESKRIHFARTRPPFSFVWRKNRPKRIRMTLREQAWVLVYSVFLQIPVSGVVFAVVVGFKGAIDDFLLLLVVYAAMFAAMLFAIWCWVMLSSKKFAVDHANKYFARGLCPGCGYSLAGAAPSEVTGRLRCPECGAEWRGERLPASVSSDHAVI
ncbi:MAG: hypothetical protein ACF8Q5_07790 [Phycisphaerales bacterium JB040]